MIIISPAKRQVVSHIKRANQLPACLDRTRSLLNDIVRLDLNTLTKSLAVSPALGQKAWDAFQALHQEGFNPEEAIASIDLYQGDVFKALDVSSLGDEEIQYMENNLRIISAFYGLLKPLDGIWPYRLEMGSRLPNYLPLYQYWKEEVSHAINASSPEYIFNLASAQYAKVLSDNHKAKWCDIVFQDKDTNGRYRVIAIHAKRMRGRVLRFMVQNAVTHPRQLLSFCEDNYGICESESTPHRLVFRSK